MGCTGHLEFLFKKSGQVSREFPRTGQALDFTDHLTPQTFADTLEFKRSGLIAGFLHTGRRIIGITFLLLTAE